MQERYFLKEKEITLGEIVREDGRFSFLIHKPDPSDPSIDKSTGYYPIWFYPCEFYLLGRRNLNYKVSHEDIVDFFDNRAMDKNRVAIDEYLYSLGLTEWDGWEICKRTKAINFEDFYWITQDESEDYRNVLARY